MQSNSKPKGKGVFYKKKKGKNGLQVVPATSQAAMSSRLPGVIRSFDDDDDDVAIGGKNTSGTGKTTKPTQIPTSNSNLKKDLGVKKEVTSGSKKKPDRSADPDQLKKKDEIRKPNVSTTPTSTNLSSTKPSNTANQTTPSSSSRSKAPLPSETPSSKRSPASTSTPPTSSTTSPFQSDRKVDQSSQVQTQEGLPTMYTISTEEQLERFFSAVLEKESVPKKKKGGSRFEGLVFGFDVEFTRDKTVATIQLSTRSLACVIQAGLMASQQQQQHQPQQQPQLKQEGEDLVKEQEEVVAGSSNSILPSSLIEFLECERTTKLGVGVHGDAEAIFDTFGRKCNGLVDISVVAIKQGISHGYRSLKLLAQDLLQVEKTQSMGGWMRRHLSSEQVRYAAMDAWLGIELGWTLFEYLKVNESQTFFDWTLLNQTSLQDLEDLNLQHAIPLPFIPSSSFSSPSPSFEEGSTNGSGSGSVSGSGSGSGGGNTGKHLDRFQRERMEKREKKALEGYHRKRLEARKKHNQYVSKVETTISSLVSNMKRKKEEALEEALSKDKKKGGSGGGNKKPKLEEEGEKKQTTTEDDEDDGMMLANFIC